MATKTLYNTSTQMFQTNTKTINEMEQAHFKKLLELLVGNQEIPDKLKDVTALIKHIVERAAQVQAPIETIVGELKTFIDTDKLKALCMYYKMYLEQLLKKLDRSPVVPTHLDDVNWRVHLKLGNDSLHKILEPSALFQFELSDPNEQNKSNFLLEFSHDELYDFFNQIEDIQEQLDSLNS
eukprot:TRINITY_DN6836_c0_g6_i1.p1 TRINITY_DN6836_c0_g6~~TRINITY_DN6836_c0_g6_i1.p1  ORF type:complete len:181 (+),score=42.28 TRINITY_DN6836_c0_g6_i1:25-567(+)